jgi:hypothetical protein
MCDGATDQELAAIGTSPVTGTAFTTSQSAAGSGHAPSTKMSAADEFQFELATGAFYQRAMVTWFAALHRIGMFINILAGTAAVAVIKDDPALARALALLLAMISSANLAFDFAGLARRHSELRRMYHDLAAELEEGARDDVEIKKLRARMIREAADSPIVFEAAEKMAFNAAIRSLGRTANDEFILTASQRWLRHVWPFSGARFRQRKDN